MSNSISLKKESKLLARHSLIYGAGNILNRFAGFLLIPLYTKYLSTFEYGIKELVGLSTEIVSGLLATAIATGIYRFYFEHEDSDYRNSVISTSVLSIGIFGGIVIFLLFFSTNFMAKNILDSDKLGIYFQISFASMWFQSLNNIGYIYLRAKQKSAKFVILSSLSLVVAIAFNIYFIVFLKTGVIGIFYSTLLTSVLVCAILMVPIMMNVKFRFSLQVLKEMLKFGIPLIPSQMGAFMVHISDRFFIKAYSGISEAGVYALGYRFGTLPNELVSSPFNQIWQPRRFELYKEEGAEKVFGRIFTYFLGGMIFCSLGISVLSKDILIWIAAPNYWPAYKIVPIIALGICIFSMQYHFNMGLLIEKKTKYLGYIDFSNGIFIIILNIILIKKYGVYGAALATLFAFIYKVSLVYIFSNKYYKIYIETIRLIKLILSALIIYICSLFISSHSIVLNISMKLCLLIVYPVLLYLFQFFTDIEILNMKSYCNKFIYAWRTSTL